MKQKKHDVLLVASIIIIAVLAMVVIRYFHNSGELVVVTVNGEEYGTYNLNENQVVQIDTEYGSNTLTIKNGKADMTAADCPDKICVKESPLNDDSPSTIVCLPHKLIVEIKQR